MTTWIAISRDEHKNIRWNADSHYRFAASHTVVAANIGELTHLLPYYALGFIRVNHRFEFIAILGLFNEQNLYVNAKGQWLSSYVPGVIRGYPFLIAPNESGEHVLCIASEAMDEAISNPKLFDAEGNLHEAAALKLDFLTELERAKNSTKIACAALTEADVIVPWPLSIAPEDRDEPINVEGLFKIDEDRLNNLDGDTLTKLRNLGALGIAYAQLFSINQIHALSTLSKYHAENKTFSTVTEKNAANFEEPGSISFDNL